jgi:arginase family enzyme
MTLDFLQPLDNDFIIFTQSLSSQTLGKKINYHTVNDFPLLDGASIAIIGVLENRGTGEINKNVDLIPIRKELYSLFPGNWQSKIIDLGNIQRGESINDTYFLLKNIVSYLIKNQIIPIVIGGSQDLTYAIYRAYDQLDQMVNLTCIDNKFDFARENSNDVDSYLTKIIVEEPTNLYNYSNLGYQTYYNSQEEIDLIEKLFFDAYRLGDVSNNIAISEPVFRDSDIVSVDLNALKSSSSGNLTIFAPNGLSGKEICQLSRYAGISDKVSCFGVFNHHDSKIEATLIAQILWYFIEGVHFRINEVFLKEKDEYLKYIVTLEYELIFFKSIKSERWWIEIPIISKQHNKVKKAAFIPCLYEDYVEASKGNIPEKWWKAQRKSMLG